MSISSNVQKTKKRIAEAATKVNRSPDEVALVAATKNRDTNQIKEAIEAGISIIGENKVQEAREKIAFLGRNREKWHFIGHLQTNKAKSAVELFELIQSVDSQRLIEAINQEALKLDKKMDILIEINLTGNPEKYGLAPSEILDFVRRNSNLRGVSIKGLMMIAPWVEPEKTRPYFRELRGIFESIKTERIEGVEMRWLSMGMSDDFHIAVGEGSNMVRVGRVIFEEEK